MAHTVKPLDDQLQLLLKQRKALGRLRRLPPDSNKVDFSSNSYLSLSSHPKVVRSYLDYLRLAGNKLSLGSGGSRLLDGNSTFAEDLEKYIAAFHRAPSGLLFNSGFEANTGLFSCVPQPGDVVVYDELVHASIHDGLKLSRAGERIPFAHNLVYRTAGQSADIPSSLEAAIHDNTSEGLDEVLQKLTGGSLGSKVRSGLINVFIAVEGLYSMDGDTAPLPDIVRCIRDRLPSGNGHLIVDEAHSTGLYDKDGQGLVCELGLEKHAWARVHTFGKAIGCSGGE